MPSSRRLSSSESTVAASAAMSSTASTRVATSSMSGTSLWGNGNNNNNNNTTNMMMHQPQHHWDERYSQLLDEADHVRCSTGNQQALLEVKLEKLRQLEHTIRQDDWKYQQPSNNNNNGITSGQPRAAWQLQDPAFLENQSERAPQYPSMSG